MKHAVNKNLELEIVSSTGDGDAVAAAALLIFTKSTRLQMDGAKYKDLLERCRIEPDWMDSQLRYMAKTIRSSWEFLDVTFAIKNVSRACAQQITRTRFTPIDGDLFGSYAMQSQRVTDMTEATWHNPLTDNDSGTEEQRSSFDGMCQNSKDNYQKLVSDGIPLEDARGVLPMNLHCSLVAKYNLRLLVDLVQGRESYRAQGEFNQLAAMMKYSVIELWPWASMFFLPKDALASLAIEDLRLAIRCVAAKYEIDGLNTHDVMIKLAKVNDLLQGGK